MSRRVRLGHRSNCNLTVTRFVFLDTADFLLCQRPETEDKDPRCDILKKELGGQEGPGPSRLKCGRPLHVVVSPLPHVPHILLLTLVHSEEVWTHRRPETPPRVPTSCESYLKTGNCLFLLYRRPTGLLKIKNSEVSRRTR